MNYEEVRDKIQTGDIISVRNNKGFMHKLTRLVTRSPYTHSGIAIWLDEGLWMAEINGGKNHLIPLSQVDGIDFDVSECPVDRETVKKEILDSLRVSLTYGFVSFVIIGLFDLFKIKERFRSMKSKVCSEYIQAILVASGWDVPEDMVSPYDLEQKLKLKFEVRN